MATTHAPGIRPDGGRHGRRATVAAAVVLAFAAIVVPFGLHAVGRNGAQASSATHPSATPTTAAHRDATTDASLGPRGDLPALLPARRSSLTDGTRVRLGDVTDGVLRRTPDGRWQVLVRWNSRLQPVALRGPVRLRGYAAGQPSVSWVSADRLLYTRVSTASPHRFHVYAWEPRGGSAYTPPRLVATALGRVCFNRTFTAFGDCRTSG